MDFEAHPQPKIKKEDLVLGPAPFLPPEVLDLTSLEDTSGFGDKSSWDVALRYQDIKRYGHIPTKEKQRLKARAVSAVLEKAQSILGSLLKPEKNITTDYHEYIQRGSRGELDVLSSIEESILSLGMNRPQLDLLRFNTKTEKESHIAVVMDASLSMRGEKLALLAVSAAVVALCVPSKRLSLMGFDSAVRWIKRFGEEVTVEKIIELVLELPAGGFTNLEIALSETEKMLRRTHKPHANVILITDGKYTEGADPTPLAAQFKHLNSLKIGRDQAGRRLLLDLVAKGHGKLFEAGRPTELPRTMYAAIRTLLR